MQSNRRIPGGRWAARAGGVALALAVAACGSNRFAPPVAGFATAVGALEEAHRSGVAAARADTDAVLRLKLAAGPTPIELARSCRVPAGVSAAPCVVFAPTLLPAGEAQPQPLLAEQNLAKARPAARALRDYAAALAALTEAKDRAAYDSAAAAVQGQVEVLAATASAAAPEALLVPLVTKPLLWLVGEALDAEREAMLRRAVPAAAPHVRTLARMLGDGLLEVQQARMAALWEAADLRTRGDGRRPGGPALPRYEAASVTLAALNPIRASNPQAAAEALIAAHDRLAGALADPAANAAALAAAVGDFARQADETRTAFAKAGQS